MKRIIHPDLQRGPVAQRAAILLWLALMTVLCVSVLHGMAGLIL